MANGWCNGDLEGVLFDLDGTLYHQGALRRRMFLELMRLPLRTRSLAATRRVLRRLERFRRVREELRALGRTDRPLADLQYDEAALQLGEDPQVVRQTIDEWIHHRPLLHLRPCLRADLLPFLAWLRGRGLRVGVFSDYPVDAKLAAMGLSGHVDLRLDATDAEINAFKPHPRGFLVACERWDVEPRQVLYVGDRPDVDGEGARAAGMPCAILGRRGGDGARSFTSLDGLRRALEENQAGERRARRRADVSASWLRHGARVGGAGLVSPGTAGREPSPGDRRRGLSSSGR